MLSIRLIRISTLWLACLGLSLVCFSITSYAQADTLHSKWQSLLNKHVQSINNGHSTEVDYAGFVTDRTKLKAYLNELTNVSQDTFDSWNEAEELSFLINAYNAWTVEFILTEYPDIDSIKDLGGLFSSPWSKSFIPLLGKTYSLDNIEHDLIRGGNKYNDPRIHFAVNCASIGCPALREEAFHANQLDSQLALQTARFLSDSSRNYIDGNQLYLSPIFKWYKGDFEQGFRDATTLSAFIALYAKELGLSEQQISRLLNGDIDIRYLDYNWQLNDRY